MVGGSPKQQVLWYVPGKQWSVPTKMALGRTTSATVTGTKAPKAQLAENVKVSYGRKESECTVHSLVFMGLHNCRPVKIPTLTPIHHLKHLQ